MSVGLGHHFVHYIFYYSHQIERVGHGFYQFVANIEIFVGKLHLVVALCGGFGFAFEVVGKGLAQQFAAFLGVVGSEHAIAQIEVAQHAPHLSLAILCATCALVLAHGEVHRVEVAQITYHQSHRRR